MFHVLYFLLNLQVEQPPAEHQLTNLGRRNTRIKLLFYYLNLGPDVDE
jgi:hypothetical protein